MQHRCNTGVGGPFFPCCTFDVHSFDKGRLLSTTPTPVIDRGLAEVLTKLKSRPSELHATIALLQLAVLGRFLSAAPRAPWYLHGLVGCDTAFRIVFRVLLGGACSSTTISAALHARFATSPVPRIRLGMFASEALFVHALAAHLLRRSEGTAAKLQLLSVAALVHIFVVGWWCTHNLTHIPVFLSSIVLGLLSLSFSYSVTKSRVLGLVTFFIAPAVLMGVAALNACYPVDSGNRLVHHPDSAQNPHWSVAIRWCCQILFFAMAAAMSHAVSKLHCRTALTAPELAAHFSLANLKIAQWPVLVLAAAVAIQNPGINIRWQDLLDALAATTAKAASGSAGQVEALRVAVAEAKALAEQQRQALARENSTLAAALADARELAERKREALVAESSKWHVEDIGLLVWVLFCALSLLAIWITSSQTDCGSHRATERNRRTASASNAGDKDGDEVGTKQRRVVGMHKKLAEREHAAMRDQWRRPQ